MNHRLATLLVLTLAAPALAGCLGGAQPVAQGTTNLDAPEITEEARDQFEQLTQVIPSNYTFPGQQALESVVVWLNDTVDSAANAAIESPGDDGGMRFQTPVKAQDFSAQIPPRQAVEIHITLFWSGNPGQSADLDIFTDLPGVEGAFDPSQGQEMNWNRPVKRTVVNTVGVEGRQHLIGVQVTNGRIAPGAVVPYTLQISFDYAQDVLTPYHPYAFTLPEGATGVVLRSAKVTGDEHITAAFAILSPQDELVSYQLYDDIAIPTESVFIPLRQPGEYVFYAYEMVGGFLTLRADSPVPMREVRILPLVEETVMDFQQPLAPGIVGHHIVFNSGNGLPIDGTPVDTPAQPGAVAGTFTVDATYPLRIEGVFAEGQAIAGDVQLTIRNDKGVVWNGVRSLRADFGEQGSLGWSGDHAPFVTSDPSLLGKGAYTVEVTVNGYTGQLGHTVLTYQRPPGSAAQGGA